MRALLLKKLKAEQKQIQVELKKLENEISVLSGEFVEEKKLKKLARMIYAEEFNEDRRKIDEAD